MFQLYADYVLLPEKNVRAKLRERRRRNSASQASIPCASFARISTLFKPFIEFITIAKTAPFRVVFAYRCVLHAHINHDK